MSRNTVLSPVAERYSEMGYDAWLSPFETDWCLGRSCPECEQGGMRFIGRRKSEGIGTTRVGIAHCDRCGYEFEY